MASAQPTHVLYHNYFSICSIMARYTYALRGEPKSANDDIRLEQKSIELPKGEQLTEHYLCDINPAGEVPVLAPIDSTKTIPDSLVITRYIAQRYPSLIPESHAEQINSLLAELHEINFFSLTFTGQPEGVQARKAMLEKKLGESISDRYREAIKSKLKRYNNTKLGGLAEDVVEANIEKARNLMLRFQDMLHESGSGWLMGSEKPSALDAHLVVFIARMYDAKRAELIPPRLKEYGERAMDGEAWKNVMEGRNTMPPWN